MIYHSSHFGYISFLLQVNNFKSGNASISNHNNHIVSCALKCFCTEIHISNGSKSCSDLQINETLFQYFKFKLKLKQFLILITTFVDFSTFIN